MPNQAPAHWSKDFVEHLRTVHFALMTISAGLILLVFSSKEYNAVKALVQIDEILDLKHEWSLKWVQQFAQKGHFVADTDNGLIAPDDNDDSQPEEGENVAIPDEGTAALGTFEGIDKHDKLRKIPLACDFRKDDWFSLPPVFESRVLEPEKFPRTLKEFQKWWLNIREPYSIYIPTHFLSISSAFRGTNLTNGGFTFEKFSDKIPDSYKKIHLSIGKRMTIEGDGMSYYGFFEDSNFDGSMMLELYVTKNEKYDVSRQSVSSVYGSVNTEEFDRAFADLAIGARDEVDLPLEEIKSFLHDDAAKGTEVFEAFGMKFPAGQITFWGTVLLLSVQLYFLVYLRRLSGKLRPDDPGWDVPWIGMDSSWPSNTILYVSLVMLPCIAAILLGWQTTVRLSSGYWERTEHWYRPAHFLAAPWHWHYTVILKILLLILAAIASGYLGLRCWKYRPQIAPEPPTPPSCPAQLFE